MSLFGVTYVYVSSALFFFFCTLTYLPTQMHLFARLVALYWAITLLATIKCVICSGTSLTVQDCVLLSDCSLPLNVSGDVILQDCCWNGTASRRSVLVPAANLPAQRVVVVLRRVVVVDGVHVVNVESARQDLDRFPDTNGWGVVIVSVLDSVVRLAAGGSLIVCTSTSMALIELDVRRTTVEYFGTAVTPRRPVENLAWLVHLDRTGVDKIIVTVEGANMTSVSGGTAVIFLGRVTAAAVNQSTSSMPTTSSFVPSTHSLCSICISSSIFNVSSGSDEQAVSMRALLSTTQSLLSGEFLFTNASFDVSSVTNSMLSDVRDTNMSNVRFVVENVVVAVTSIGAPQQSPLEVRSTVLSFLFARLLHSFVQVRNINATVTVPSGVANVSAYGSIERVDATLVYLFQIANSSVQVQDVFVRTRAIGGDIAPARGYTPMTALQAALVVIPRGSSLVVNVSIVVERVRLDVYVEATAAAAPHTFVARGVVHLAYLVVVAAASFDVFVSVSNSHMSCWTNLPDRAFLVDARVALVVAFTDPAALFNPLVGMGADVSLLTVTRCNATVSNVSVARMDEEWATTSLIGLSMNLISCRILVSSCRSHALSRRSAPPTFQDREFALSFGPESVLTPSDHEHASLLWSATAYLGSILIGSGSSFSFENLTWSPVSRLVSPIYIRFGAGTNPLGGLIRLGPSSLSVPDSAFFECALCAIGSQDSAEPLSPALIDSPAIQGLVPPVLGLRIALLNVTFTSPRAAYFNISEVSALANFTNATISRHNNRSLLLGCNTQRNSSTSPPWSAVEVPDIVQAAFNVSRILCQPPANNSTLSAPEAHHATPPASAALATAVFVAVGLSGIFQGAKPLFVQVSMLSLSLTDSDGCVPSFGPMSSPTTLSLPTSGTSHNDRLAATLSEARGTVVGNAVLVVASAALLLTFGSAVHVVRLRRFVAATGWAVKRLAIKSCTTVAIPGVLAPVFFFLLQPTLEASVFLLLSTAELGSLAVGVCGVVTIVSTCIVALRLATRMVPCSCIPRQHRARRGSWCRDLVSAVTRPRYQWVPRPPPTVRCSRDRSMRYLRCYGELFESYRSRKAAWFLTAELGTAFVCGCIAGAADTIGCDLSAQLLLSIAGAVLIVVVVYRPFVSVLLNLNCAAGSAFSVACSALAVSGLQEAASGIAQVQLGVSVALVLVSWATAAFYGKSRLWNLLRSGWWAPNTRKQSQTLRKHHKHMRQELRGVWPRSADKSVPPTEVLRQLVFLVCANRQKTHC